MTVKPYGQKEALAILEPTGFQDEWTVDDQGLWPSADFEQTSLHDAEFASWRPVLAYADDLDAPNPINTPALPFPFDGRDLAAFMLNGFGGAVVHFYGGWDSGLDEFQLSQISPVNTFAKRAVKEAFDAYRKAVTKVGKWDADVLARREAAHKAYWSSNNDQTLLKAFEDAQAEWDDAHSKWLTAMVKTLLETKAQAAPEPTHAVPAIASKPTAIERQKSRWKACEDAGLEMPTNTFANYPRGIGKVAKGLGITHQSLKEDLDKYRNRTMGK